MIGRSFTSIDDEIEMLARLTGAAPAFVEQVRALFRSKAISLQEDVGPFQAALEDAFRREESLRACSKRARQGISGIRENLGRARELNRESAERLREASASLERNAGRIRRSAERLGSAAWVLSPGRKPVRDAALPPIVPGPDDIQ